MIWLIFLICFSLAIAGMLRNSMYDGSFGRPTKRVMDRVTSSPITWIIVLVIVSVVVHAAYG